MTALIQISTNDVGPADRLEYWSETLSESYETKAFYANSGVSLAGRVQAVDFDSHVISKVQQGPASCVHTAQQARSDAASVSLFFVQQGLLDITAGNTNVQVKPGQLFVSDSEQPYRHEFTKQVGMTILQFPKEAYLAGTGKSSHENGRLLDQNNASTRMLTKLVSDYWREVSLGLSSDQAVTMETVMLQMLKSALGSNQADLGNMGHLDKVRRFIESHLHEHQLTPAAIAEGNGMSLRKLHSLFASNGETVAKYIKHRRLSQAAAMLQHPDQAEKDLAEVAFEVGFLNASHFSRTFKAEFGVTPRAYQRDKL